MHPNQFTRELTRNQNILKSRRINFSGIKYLGKSEAKRDKMDIRRKMAWKLRLPVKGYVSIKGLTA